MIDVRSRGHQRLLSIRSDRKASRVRSACELVYIVRQSRLTKKPEQLREGLMIFDRKLSALAGRDRFRIEQARADICAERHASGIAL